MHHLPSFLQVKPWTLIVVLVISLVFRGSGVATSRSGVGLKYLANCVMQAPLSCRANSLQLCQAKVENIAIEEILQNSSAELPDLPEQYRLRFMNVGRLYHGVDSLRRLYRSHVCVIGLGGVGSWVVEALARSGVGSMTLIDVDDICVSNVNRQVSFPPYRPF